MLGQSAPLQGCMVACVARICYEELQVVAAELPENLVLCSTVRTARSVATQDFLYRGAGVAGLSARLNRLSAAPGPRPGRRLSAAVLGQNPDGVGHSSPRYRSRFSSLSSSYSAASIISKNRRLTSSESCPYPSGLW